MTYKVYVTDALMDTLNTIRVVVGGQPSETRFYDIIRNNFTPMPKADGDEIAVSVIKNAGLRFSFDDEEIENESS